MAKKGNKAKGVEEIVVYPYPLKVVEVLTYHVEG
jgi:hypothetical protein